MGTWMIWEHMQFCIVSGSTASTWLPVPPGARRTNQPEKMDKYWTVDSLIIRHSQKILKAKWVMGRWNLKVREHGFSAMIWSHWVCLQEFGGARYYHDLLSIETVATLNAAFCDYHLKHCPPSQQLHDVCKTVRTTCENNGVRDDFVPPWHKG